MSRRADNVAAPPEGETAAVEVTLGEADNVAAPPEGEAATIEIAFGGDAGALVAPGRRGPSAAIIGQLSAGGHAGLPAHALAPFLIPQRAGDPLGIGLSAETRPPAPPDPDVYDRAREDAEFARSLLNDKERAAVDSEVDRNGYLPIQKVRALVAENTAKGSVEAGGLDPEVMALLDARIDYKIFVAGDNLYTREELYEHFPFHEFNVQPEAIFLQQELGVFPPRATALKSELEYVARDAGDESVDFVMLEDLVGQAARANYKKRRTPLRIAKTKIYVGKERWEDFLLMQRFARGAMRVAAAQIAYGGTTAASPILALLTGASRGSAPLALTDPAALEAERRAREAEAAHREENIRRREEALLRREEEAGRAAEEASRRIAADLRRVEEMLAAWSATGAAPRARAPAPPVPPAPHAQPVDGNSASVGCQPAPEPAPADDDDSVPL